MAVRNTRGMIAAMAPRLVERDWVYCCFAPADPHLTDCLPQAFAAIREEEGVTLILPASVADGRDGEGPMARIQLDVHSALDGVGLTAAVSQALAAHGIPANVVAGFHHDHVFVPAGQADAALTVLRNRAAQESL